MGGGKATRGVGMLPPHAWCSESDSGDEEEAAAEEGEEGGRDSDGDDSMNDEEAVHEEEVVQEEEAADEEEAVLGQLLRQGAEEDAARRQWLKQWKRQGEYVFPRWCGPCRIA